MLVDDVTLRQLRFRSDLPRLTEEGFSVFAQLEPEEQRASETEKVRLLMRAHAALVAKEEAMSERPLPALLPRAYRAHVLDSDFTEYECAFDLESPFERRTRDGRVLAITHHVRARLRVFKGAFAYSTPDDARPLEMLDTSGWTAV
jgi:hypothetical protein